MGSEAGAYALLAADIFVEFALFEAQDYLTSVWDLGFTHAAGILNVWGGIARLLVVFFQFVKELWALLISTAPSFLGIACVALSTPPIIARATKSCKDFNHECITGTHKALFYSGMSILAVGVAGRARYFRIREASTTSSRELSCSAVMSFLLVVAAAGLSIWLHFVNSWSVRFGVPAIISVSASFVFYLCSCNYVRRWGSIRDTNVEEAEFRARMIPVLLNVVVCGIVSSTGNTYFVEQAKNMDPHVGRVKFPLAVFLAIVGLAKAVFVCLIRRFFTSYRRGCACSFGIGIAMIFGILCCVTAARVEEKRLSLLRTSPMSMFWLAPQFILLRGMDSWLEKSTSAFYRNQFPRSRSTNKLENFTLAAQGLGYVCGVGLVRLLGFISWRAGNSSWFQHTLNRSRLDRYYWVLAALSFVNVVAFVVLACCFYSYSEENNAAGGGGDDDDREERHRNAFLARSFS